MVFHFVFCTAGNFCWGVVRGSAVETRLQNEMVTASSPGSHSLSPVAASLARISWNGVYSCPEMPHWDVWPKHQLPFTGGPQYQRKTYRPAAGRGMNPRQCVKIMWGLVNRHGQGMRHSLSHGIRHTACRKDNRWHENPLFSPSSSRRSYWWETRQNFPESQSLSKELLHFHDSESKYFCSVSITVASPAAEDSPHLLHIVTSQSYSQSMKTLTTGCYHFSISYFTLVWGSASPSDGEIVRLPISYIMLTSAIVPPTPP